MSLNGIDIAAYQSNISIGSLSTTDFVIIKATQGTSYTNEYFVKHMDAAIKAGKRVGAYHYANGVGAEAEAKYFLSVVKPYLGKIVLALDWETGTSSAAKNSQFNNVSYAKQWLDYVKAQTGVSPVIYMSESVAAGKDWSSVAKDYKLWGAQYPNYTATNYKTDPWMSGGWGAWGSKPTIFQYTSSGYITGYSSNLDLDLFYGSGADWDVMTKSASSSASTVTGQWMKNSTGWWYKYSDGSWPYSTWKKIDGKWYYFNSDGYMVASSLLTYNGKQYYVGSDGAMVTSTSWTYNGVIYTADADGVITTKTATTTTTATATTLAKKYVNKNAEAYVYADTTLNTKTGSLNAKEECQCLDTVNKRYLVLYKVDGTDYYKTGFVKYNGLV